MKKFLEIKIKFQALGFYLTVFEVNKLTCHCFMDTDKRHETLGSKTEDVIIPEHSKKHEHHVDISFSCPPSLQGVTLSSPGECG